MRAPEHVYERLSRANPVVDTTPFQPERADAIAFAQQIEGRAIGAETMRQPPAISQVSASHIAVAVGVFVGVVAIGGLAVVLSSDNGTDAVAPPPTTASPQPREEPVAEPERLAQARQAVNSGEAVAAAAVHGEGGECDRFFTTGTESCEDWYAFLVGIGVEVTAAECAAEDDHVSCRWTVASDLHEAVGVDPARWDFTRIDLDGWAAAVQPDSNLLTGIPGESALDTDFWEFVTDRIENRQSAPAPRASARVPATLNAEFAASVLEAANEWDEAR